MENDPNKKESKGKRIFKKALRRNSKTSNNGQGPAPDHEAITVTRSKSFEISGFTLEINDSAPLPKPDGTAGRIDPAKAPPPSFQPAITRSALSDVFKSKKVEIHESQNATISEAPELDQDNAKELIILPAPNKPNSSALISGKRNLKRKLEEDSEAAGTSGAGSSSAGASDTDADDKDPSKDKKKKNRCAVCRKKVGLTGFECRCGGLFCAVHRYSDKHECSFDYRELGAQEIRRNNPVVVSQKIHKI